MDKKIEDELTYNIIGCAMKVHNTIFSGFQKVIRLKKVCSLTLVQQVLKSNACSGNITPENPFIRVILIQTIEIIKVCHKIKRIKAYPALAGSNY